MVDSKLFFVGNNLVDYALYKNDENNNKICLSEYYDSTGKFISNRIPLSSTTVNNLNIKFPTNCHTTREIIDSEPVIMVVFDNLGNETAEVVLYAHDAFILNDLTFNSCAYEIDTRKNTKNINNNCFIICNCISFINCSG